MTKLSVEWDYDVEDDVTRTAESETFFAAWVNQFGVVEWTCTDEDEFAELVDVLQRHTP